MDGSKCSPGPEGELKEKCTVPYNTHKNAHINIPSRWVPLASSRAHCVDAHVCARTHARLRAHPLEEPRTIWISRVMLWQIFVRLHFYACIFRCKWQVVFKAHTLTLLRFFSINLMFYHLQIKFIVSKCANRHLCAVCAPLMANKVFLLTITWGVLSQMPPFQTPDSQSAPRGQSSSLGGRSPALRPSGALPWCSFSRGVTQEGPNARQGSGVWDDGEKEPEKVKEDRKCFEWGKRRRDEEERRRARMRWGENQGVQG